MATHFVYLDVEVDPPVLSVTTESTARSLGILIDSFESSLEATEALAGIAERRNRLLLESFTCPKCRRRAP